MYRYMVAYSSQVPHGFAHGNCEIKLPQPITSMDDVHDVTDMLRNHFNLTNPILMSFSRFADAPRSEAS